MSIQALLNNFTYKDYGHANDNLSMDNSLELINCSLGTNPFKDEYKIVDLFKTINFENAKSYQDPKLFEEFYLSIKKRHQVKIEKEQVFFGHGLIVVLERLATKFCDKSKPCLGIGPQFTYFIDDFVVTGGKYESIDILKNKDYIELIKSKLISGKYATFYLDNPNNPTGQIMNLETITEIAEICDKNDVLFILDEAYGDFMPISNSGFNIINKFENLIVLRSMSKGYGIAGLRSAYLATSKKLAPFYDKIDLGFEPNFFAIKVSSILLNEFEWFLKESVEKVNFIKPKFIKFLESKSIEVISSHENTSIFFAKSDKHNLFNRFNEIGVLSSCGEGFSSSLNYLTNNYIRFLCPKSEEQLNSIINRYNQKYD